MNFDNLSKTWYAGFIKILTEGVAKNKVSSIFENVTFLSFNYDRCIEQYLYEAIQVTYGLDAKDAAILLSGLKILHPYGSVGKLPWQNPDTNENVPYGAERNDLLKVSKQIKTFNERIHDPEELEKLHDAIQSAETIVFLGFAFHRPNLELITPKKPCNAKRIYATAYGISQNDCNEIIGDIHKLLKQSSPVSVQFRIDLKCADLFSEYWRSLTAS